MKTNHFGMVHFEIDIQEGYDGWGRIKEMGDRG